MRQRHGHGGFNVGVGQGVGEVSELHRAGSDVEWTIAGQIQQLQRHPQQQESEPESEDKHDVTDTTISNKSFIAACVLLLLPIRIICALIMPIQDCDEQFNYWEPLHYLLFGRGLQTWEYSPAYGLRSYAYILLTSIPAWNVRWAQAAVLGVNAEDGSMDASTHHKAAAMTSSSSSSLLASKLILFYSIRLTFAILCSLVETRLLRTIRRRIHPSVARWCLLLLACSAGMSHAAHAYLPQTFTMIATMCVMEAWMNRAYSRAIFFTGICCLIGWPFSFLLSLPLAIEILYVYGIRKLYKPTGAGLATLFACIVPSVVLDLIYYRRPLLAVLNIAIYNSNASSEHGANLYGREPASYYFINLFLNFNVASFIAYVTPPLLLVNRMWRMRSRRLAHISEFSVLRYLTPFYLWFLLFLSMPHKEERFLFVVYPYLALAAAVGAYAIQRILRGESVAFIVERARDKKQRKGSFMRRLLSILLILALCSSFILLSLSRSLSLFLNYRAPVQVWSELEHRARDAVVEKENLPFPLAIQRDDTVIQPQSTDLSDMGRSESVTVCVGKEWYRIPSHFFLPSIRIPSISAEQQRQRLLHYRLKFLDSEFGGLLPRPYLEAEQWKGEMRETGAEEPPNILTTQTLRASVGKIKQLLHHASILSNNITEHAASFLSSPFSHHFLPHTHTRPGTFVLPASMNDLNRKEKGGGRFVHSTGECHYIVDLNLGQASQHEPDYSQYEERFPKSKQIGGRCVAGWRWHVEMEYPFLDASSSPSPWLRAFWIPYISSSKNVMKPYQLLQRYPIDCEDAAGVATAQN